MTGADRTAFDVGMLRGIRAKDAPRYLGMDRNRFNRLVRPHLTLIQYGPQTKVFDRLELDRWVEDDKSRNGRPAMKGGITWGVDAVPDSANATGSGTSKSSSLESRFMKVVERATLRKPKPTSRNDSTRSAKPSF